MSFQYSRTAVETYNLNEVNDMTIVTEDHELYTKSDVTLCCKKCGSMKIVHALNLKYNYKCMFCKKINKAIGLNPEFNQSNIEDFITLDSEITERITNVYNGMIQHCRNNQFIISDTPQGTKIPGHELLGYDVIALFKFFQSDRNWSAYIDHAKSFEANHKLPLFVASLLYQYAINPVKARIDNPKRTEDLNCIDLNPSIFTPRAMEIIRTYFNDPKIIHGFMNINLIEHKVNNKHYRTISQNLMKVIELIQKIETKINSENVDISVDENTDISNMNESFNDSNTKLEPLPMPS